MSRVSIKAVGSSGQGINSIGEVIAKGLKRSGYSVFGYREYPSLIKGGHASFQIDVDSIPVRSPGTKTDILITLNHHGFEHNLYDLKKGGIIIHDVDFWEFSKEEQHWIDENKIKIAYIPLDEMLKKLKARPILANVLLTSFVWDMLNQDIELLKALVREQYQHKGEDIVKKNLECVDAGCIYNDPKLGRVTVSLPKPDSQWKDQLLVTGSVAMGLGALHAGLRVYVGYPMTPSSPLLAYISSVQKEAGLVVKQAEDEITAAQMASGAFYMGTRAMTATSGGGYDLMTETMSMNGMIENAMVCVLAQRPGPATGNPTWTAQGDLLLAINSSHGEFPRLVMSVSDPEDCFSLMPEAFNFAEEYQTPVIVMTDKHIAEALCTVPMFDQKKTELRRGKLITDPIALKKLKSTDRYDPSVQDGITPRWLPGSEAETFNAQADEHNADGSIDESAEMAKAQMEKRMRKMEILKKNLPEPVLYGAKNPDILIVGWGSTKMTVLDVLESEEMKKKNIGYLHYTYLWPLKTELFEKLAKKAKKIVLIEANYQGQLGMLLRQQCGIDIKDKILKYDGRPFYFDELQNLILQNL
ncbi:MAG TPA: 2-oxoacid:acceptor oxidoreductase subunit alpha [Candidatus Peribacterales bacterium]|nr:2-oxoacid:acceptor oxidoreductase subunit alpha [Candidatus Peribacterales bacterium]